MATPFLTDFIAKIHESPSVAVLVVTGGGSQALANLFVVPGASRTVLEEVGALQRPFDARVPGPPVGAGSVGGDRGRAVPECP